VACLKVIEMEEDEKIIGIIYPLPEQLILRIFDSGKNIFTKFTTHTPSEESVRIRKGDKLFLYMSRAEKTVVGAAVIEKLDFLLPAEVIDKYKDNLITPPEEMSKYVRGRNNKKMLILKLCNIKKYSHPIEVKVPITMAGRHVTKENQRDIFKGDIQL
jgi:hypothetical protein